MNCFIYCRKSTEDQARQIQSIDDQKHILIKTARSKELRVVEIFTDEKSAGKPYQRNGFQSMMERVTSGEAAIILCWKIDRLSRNPIENGQISWMLQKGIIQEIITPDRCYLPQDNVLLYMVEGAMANQFLRDLSANVKRGMNSCVERGIYPGYAPIGYYNDGKIRGSKKIIPDPVFFPQLQSLWNLVKTGNYQLADLYRIMLDRYPLIKNGKPIAFSTFHRIFRNPFYCGLFRWNRKIHVGNHPRELDFDFKGIFKCGTCNACITAERKSKLIKSKNRLKHFDYYKCAHHRKSIKCREKPLSKKLIEVQLFEEINRISLPPEVMVYGLTELGKEDSKDLILNKAGDKEISRRIQTLTNKRKTVENNIVIESDQEIRQIMKQKLTEIKIEIKKLQEDKETLSNKLSNWNEEIKEQLQIIANAEKVLKGESKEQKQELLKNLGSNWQIKNRKIHYKPNFVSVAIKKVMENHPNKLSVFEPQEGLINKGKSMHQEYVYTIWYSLWELIKNPNNFEVKENCDMKSRFQD